MTGKRKRGDAIDFGLLPGLLGYQVRQAQIAIFRDFTSSLAEDGMTPTLFGSLVLIEANPGLKQADLARALQLDRSTVVPWSRSSTPSKNAAWSPGSAPSTTAARTPSR
jgi:hypothetical protein